MVGPLLQHNVIFRSGKLHAVAKGYNNISMDTTNRGGLWLQIDYGLSNVVALYHNKMLRAIRPHNKVKHNFATTINLFVNVMLRKPGLSTEVKRLLHLPCFVTDWFSHNYGVISW